MTATSNGRVDILAVRSGYLPLNAQNSVGILIRYAIDGLTNNGCMDGLYVIITLSTMLSG